MGYLEKKIVREKPRYFWIINTRNSHKLGEDEKDKSTAYYLGKHIFNLDYLNWYFFNGDIDKLDFLDKLDTFISKQSQLKPLTGKIRDLVENSYIRFLFSINNLKQWFELHRDLLEKYLELSESNEEKRLPTLQTQKKELLQYLNSCNKNIDYNLEIIFRYVPQTKRTIAREKIIRLYTTDNRMKEALLRIESLITPESLGYEEQAT